MVDEELGSDFSKEEERGDAGNESLRGRTLWLLASGGGGALFNTEHVFHETVDDLGRGRDDGFGWFLVHELLTNVLTIVLGLKQLLSQNVACLIST